MKYREMKRRWKYELIEEFIIQTPIRPHRAVATDYISLNNQGLLAIREGYNWDGASGGMHDDETNLTPSLIHDAFYQLLRMHRISYDLKPQIDDFFVKLCRERGMNPIRAGYYRLGLIFGRPKRPEKGDEEVWLEVR